MEVFQLGGGIEMIALGSTATRLLGLPFLPLTDKASRSYRQPYVAYVQRLVAFPHQYGRFR